MADMLLRSVFFALLIFMHLLTVGQKTLPVIKASSKYVDIRDGIRLKKQYWRIMPEQKPDHYFVEIPHKSHVVSFITDTDSISFNVEYGKEYDFIILLNNKDSCYTRIAAREKTLFPAGKSVYHQANDTLPFAIGDNSKLYLKGTVNHSDAINIQFDLGLSGQCIIKKSSVQKAGMKLDGTIILGNSDGVNEVPTSSNNTLTVAGLRWDSIPFTVADNMTKREDMIMGNALFQNKVVEINYDRMIIVIHDTMPLVDNEYTRHEMSLDAGVVPLVQGTIQFGPIISDGWFMFDTGAYTSILNNEDIPATNKIFTEVKKMVGLKPKRLELNVNGYRFSNFNYTTQRINTNEIAGLLGNDLLKRFNVILDNRNGLIYLQPNSMIKAPYANPEYNLVRVFVVIILLVALILFAIYRRKRRAKPKPVK